MRRITAASERAQDLGIGVLRPRGEVVLAVEAHADAVGDAAAAARALVRRRLRDLLDLQQRRLVAQRVALDAREPGVDHVADAGHGERRLGDVGREHDAPPARRREHALLLRHRQPRVERQDLDAARVRPAREALRAAARRSRGSRARPAGTRGCRPGLRATGPRPRATIASSSSSSSSASSSPVVERPIADLDRIHAARDLDHRRRRAPACRNAARSARRRASPT